MINHGYAPATFLQSNIVPIPKGARANVTDSNTCMAISSIMGKILDIEQQQLSLATSSYQFGFKSKASTALCTTMMVETIQYYLEKGDNFVCLLLLDASKAFDKVPFDKLFELLKNVCPRIIKLLFYLCIQFGVVPLNFRRGVLIPIPKKAGCDTTQAKNWRPITVSSTFSKLLELYALEECSSHEFSDLQFEMYQG